MIYNFEVTNRIIPIDSNGLVWVIIRFSIADPTAKQRKHVLDLRWKDLSCALKSQVRNRERLLKSRAIHIRLGKSKFSTRIMISFFFKIKLKMIPSLFLLLFSIETISNIIIIISNIFSHWKLVIIKYKKTKCNDLSSLYALPL